MGHRHSRDDLLAAAMDAVEGDGLTNLTFGRLAKRIGINDRTLVYYFPTKDDLIGAVLGAFALRLQALLEGSFGPDPLPAEAVFGRAWPALTTKDADVTFSVFFELLGLASAGLDPYRRLAELLMAGWVDWLEAHLDEPDAERRGRQALAVMAQLDGFLLLRQVAGSEAAEAAIAELGTLSPAARTPQRKGPGPG